MASNFFLRGYEKYWLLCTTINSDSFAITLVAIVSLTAFSKKTNEISIRASLKADLFSLLCFVFSLNIYESHCNYE